MPSSLEQHKLYDFIFLHASSLLFKYNSSLHNQLLLVGQSMRVMQLYTLLHCSKTGTEEATAVLMLSELQKQRGKKR